MPRYHFHFRGGDGDVVDDMGVEFESLELAYLDAYRSMVQIGADMLIEQRDPSGMRLEITDANGNPLMLLPFGEVFASRRPPKSSPARQMLHQHVERNRRLGEEIQAACVRAEASIASARLTLAWVRREVWAD